MRIVCEASSEILSDDQISIKKYIRAGNNTVINNYIDELKKGNTPTFYIDTSGIVRVSYFNNKLKMVDEDGKKAPSKFKGKSIGEVWNENNMEEIYGKKLEPLIKKLNLRQKTFCFKPSPRIFKC